MEKYLEEHHIAYRLERNQLQARQQRLQSHQWHKTFAGKTFNRDKRSEH